MVYSLEVWRVSPTNLYLRIKDNHGLDCTTRSFPSDREAREHMRTYYQNLLTDIPQVDVYFFLCIA